ncbi:hypothetical protein EMMF5_006052 [Cystobasidiomycetes sp. EMM_F5]
MSRTSSSPPAPPVSGSAITGLSAANLQALNERDRSTRSSSPQAPPSETDRQSRLTAGYDPSDIGSALSYDSNDNRVRLYDVSGKDVGHIALPAGRYEPLIHNTADFRYIVNGNEQRLAIEVNGRPSSLHEYGQAYFQDRHVRIVQLPEGTEERWRQGLPRGPAGSGHSTRRSSRASGSRHAPTPQQPERGQEDDMNIRTSRQSSFNGSEQLNPNIRPQSSASRHVASEYNQSQVGSCAENTVSPLLDWIDIQERVRLGSENVVWIPDCDDIDIPRGPDRPWVHTTSRFLYILNGNGDGWAIQFYRARRDGRRRSTASRSSEIEYLNGHEIDVVEVTPEEYQRWRNAYLREQAEGSSVGGGSRVSASNHSSGSGNSRNATDSELSSNIIYDWQRDNAVELARRSNVVLPPGSDEPWDTASRAHRYILNGNDRNEVIAVNRHVTPAEDRSHNSTYWRGREATVRQLDNDHYQQLLDTNPASRSRREEAERQNGRAAAPPPPPVHNDSPNNGFTGVHPGSSVNSGRPGGGTSNTSNPDYNSSTPGPNREYRRRQRDQTRPPGVPAHQTAQDALNTSDEVRLC